MRFLVLALTLLILGPTFLADRTVSGQGAFDFPGWGCDLVDLYPGYPGCRGYVTGVDGVGDHACLNELKEQDGTFDQREVDLANLAAARLLHLAGGPDLWTWENWMAVEAKRGLVPTCYTCLFDANNVRSEPRDHNVLPNDPRILLGAPFNPYDGSLNPLYTSRIAASLAQYPRYLNAAELLVVISQNSISAVSGPYVDPYIGWCNALAQGGYAPTPINAALNDQEFLLGAPFSLIHVPGLSRFGGVSVTSGFEGDVRDWDLDTVQGRTAQSLAEFLRSSSSEDNC